jgi:cobalamin biosynthesis Mg chelatase CobN
MAGTCRFVPGVVQRAEQLVTANQGVETEKTDPLILSRSAGSRLPRVRVSPHEVVQGRTGARRGYDAATKELMSRTSLVVVAVVAVVIVVVAALVLYRMFRRDPPGSYDAKAMHPGFRSHRGRGR